MFGLIVKVNYYYICRSILIYKRIIFNILTIFKIQSPIRKGYDLFINITI